MKLEFDGFIQEYDASWDGMLCRIVPIKDRAIPALDDDLVIRRTTSHFGTVGTKVKITIESE